MPSFETITFCLKAYERGMSVQKKGGNITDSLLPLT